jgi:hypothetical protein
MKRQPEQIPKGLCPLAQGSEELVTLGNGVVAWRCGERWRNPFGVGSVRPAFSQGSSFLATLGFGPKSRWDFSEFGLRPSFGGRLSDSGFA